LSEGAGGNTGQPDASLWGLGTSRSVEGGRSTVLTFLPISCSAQVPAFWQGESAACSGDGTRGPSSAGTGISPSRQAAPCRSPQEKQEGPSDSGGAGAAQAADEPAAAPRLPHRTGLALLLPYDVLSLGLEELPVANVANRGRNHRLAKRSS